jgi:hypothetical protein
VLGCRATHPEKETSREIYDIVTSIIWHNTFKELSKTSLSKIPETSSIDDNCIDEELMWTIAMS